jgi:hypothetical protein
LAERLSIGDREGFDFGYRTFELFGALKRHGTLGLRGSLRGSPHQAGPPAWLPLGFRSPVPPLCARRGQAYLAPGRPSTSLATWGTRLSSLSRCRAIMNRCNAKDETNTRSPVANLPAASPLSHIALSENPKEITHQEDYQYRA